MELPIVLAVAVAIGLVPAFIASNKGHGFFVWWLFGAALFIIALPVAILIQPKTREGSSQHDVIDKLDKLSRLRSEGVVSEGEFESMKQDVLANAQAPRQAVYDPTVPPNLQPTRLILYGLAILVLVLFGLFVFI